MKNLIKYILILVVGVGIGYFVLSRTSKTTITTVPKTEEQNPAKNINLVIDKSLATEKTFSDPADKYTIFKVSYPFFKNTSAEFNAKIADQVNAGIAEQKKSAGANWKARYDTQSKGENIPQFPKEADKFYFNVTWKPVQENNKFISLTLTTSAFEGGAHGYETITSYNYDVVNKKEVALASLFPNDPYYLQTISTFVRKDLTSQFRTKLNVKTKDDEANFSQVVLPMMQDGTVPDLTNFNVFTFTDSSVTFYFNQYQVAPYAMGSSTVTMPR
ncbi:DUF3298 and DUF4163 domain-containing protein [Patescibacteria group bacterium]|nr:DUF3298 and DUF4163 domain-containing protein [Patescibacteria group bacterium]